MIKTGTWVQHKHGWYGRVVGTGKNYAEDAILWCEVECEDGLMRLAPIDELHEIDHPPSATVRAQEA